MKLAMILGKKQGETIKPRLQNIKDNLDIDVFDDISEFVYNVSKRNTIYDRILVLSTKVTPSSLKELNTCWGMYSKETAIIMLSRKGQDEAKAKMFLDVFKTPVACAMLVSSTTVSVIAESVLQPTSWLNNEYGFKDFLAVELDEDEYVPPEPPKPTPPPQPVQPPVQQQAGGKKAKPAKKKRGGGLLGGIFGSRGAVEEEPEPAPEPVPAPAPESVQPEFQPQVSAQQAGAFGQVGVEQSQPVADWGSDQWGSRSEVQDEEFGDDFESEPVTPEVAGPAQASSPEGSDFSWSMPAPGQTMSQQAPQAQVAPQQRAPRPSHTQNFDAFSPASSSEVDETFSETLEEDTHQVDDFAPEGVTADVDFGEGGTLAGHEPSDFAPRPPRNAEQADENLGDVSILADEAQYRAQKEAPKVITKTVREPVLGSGSALKGVYSGRLRKVIVVTGDRGTGVTSTALNIAQALAKKVEVLYFDCDIDNHGLLNYLDYGNFKNYEKMHMEGVKVCRSSQVFNRCVISWDDNLNLLTSDYSCECSDDELTTTAQTVAERAMDYGVVVVDCPVEKLPCITDLILTGQAVICVEGSKRGFMNMLCQLESNPLHLRYKRNLVSRGVMFVTKCSPKTDLKRLLSYIKAIYQPEEVDWLGFKPIPFNGKLNDALLNTVLEG